jgi:hypothetical protein
MPSTPTAADLATSSARAALGLASLIGAAADAQWSSAPIPHTASGERPAPTGEVADPTFATVADERRLRLRAAVVAGERALRTTARDLAAAERKLHDALEAWHGTE